MIKSSSGAKKYNSEEYYKEGQGNEQDHYSEKDQIIGKSGGNVSEMLRFCKNISNEEFSAFCDNNNPVTDKNLKSCNDSDGTVGYDFTFNSSKYVSIAYIFGSEEDKMQILLAFKDAVKDQ